MKLIHFNALDTRSEEMFDSHETITGTVQCNIISNAKNNTKTLNQKEQIEL